MINADTQTLHEKVVYHPDQLQNLAVVNLLSSLHYETEVVF